ncbi:tRNA uridine-5-carboxymethylaminomethyl(34) synthesis GTPase MnmE [bacterium]|nr:tRNA uridine-5-carboxymethylaminomethyl(34) synthesis GTPase MnmE [bacterium]
MAATEFIENDDLIVARATAAGAGAVAIVRIDGNGAGELTRQLFRPRAGRGPVERPRRMVFGQWVEPVGGEVLDEGLCAFFAGPNSYTGNDLAEFYCHGGPVPSRRLIEAALAGGARMAEPGEFTRRAFLNGRMDLAQAEAVADIVAAQTDEAARLARAQLCGALSGRIGRLIDQLVNVAAEIEARIDFPEEDIGEADHDRLASAMDEAALEIDGLLATGRRGRLLREGARVALVGPPNAGKSSLLNALARRERAIVTPHPGTTRDVIECTIDLMGLPVTLIDTAGLRDSSDPVERIGIERARGEVASADVVILVQDLTDPNRGEWTDESIVDRTPDLVAMNKVDAIECGMRSAECGVENSSFITHHSSFISAVRGDGLPELERALHEKLLAGSGGGDANLAVNLRQAGQLSSAAAALGQARASFAAGAASELVMVDLREGLESLGAILGRDTGEAILNQIFSTFCLGK